MKDVMRVLLYALVVLGCFPQGASAQLAAGAPTDGFQLSDFVTGVGEVTDLTFLSDGRGVITTKGGTIVVVDARGMVIKNPAAPRITVDTESEKGLLGVVRDDSDNLYFYTSNGPTDADKHRVYKGRAAADGTVTLDMQSPIVTGGLEGPANHDGGGMVIYKGQLYIGVGDTGANDTPPDNMYGECLNHGNGKILRVNLDGSIPADNPLTGLESVTGCATRTGGTYQMLPPDKRIYAWGFRNPWRLWIDARTDLMWIGDVGETTQEEITVGGKGSNHGWPFREGTVVYQQLLGGLNDCMAMTPASACVAPQDTYAHDGDDASVTGGLVPTAGCGWGDYENRYFFGDYNRGTIWTLDLKPDRSGAVPGSRKVFGTVPANVSFRMGPDGAMYIAAHDLGIVKRIAPKTIPATCPAAQAPSGTPDGGGAGGAGGSGGSGGAGGAAGRDAGGSGGAGGTAGAGAGGAGTAGASGGMEPGGCSCDVGARERNGLALGVLLVVAMTLGRRRRR